MMRRSSIADTTSARSSSGENASGVGVITYEDLRAHINAEENSPAASYGELFDCSDATTDLTQNSASVAKVLTLTGTGTIDTGGNNVTFANAVGAITLITGVLILISPIMGTLLTVWFFVYLVAIVDWFSRRVLSPT